MFRFTQCTRHRIASGFQSATWIPTSLKDRHQERVQLPYLRTRYRSQESTAGRRNANWRHLQQRYRGSNASLMATYGDLQKSQWDQPNYSRSRNSESSNSAFGVSSILSAIICAESNSTHPSPVATICSTMISCGDVHRDGIHSHMPGARWGTAALQGKESSASP